MAARTAQDREALAFQFAVTTGKPRLGLRRFRVAAEWLARLRTERAARRPAAPTTRPRRWPKGARCWRCCRSTNSPGCRARTGSVPARFAAGRRARHAQRLHSRQPEPSRTSAPARTTSRTSPAGGSASSGRGVQHGSGVRPVGRTRRPGARARNSIATPGLGAGPTRIAHLDRERILALARLRVRRGALESASGRDAALRPSRR